MESIILEYISMLVFLFPLIVFILSVINRRSTQPTSILNEIETSLNDYPLADLSYSVDCKEKYANKLYTFPGSQRGCSCINVNEYRVEQKDQFTVSIGECLHNQTINGCKKILEEPKVDIFLWDNGSFCSKQYNDIEEDGLKGYLLFLKHSVLEKEECEKGYKKCGKLDDMGNYLCIKENDDCPINDIQVKNSEDKDLERKNYSHFIINNKYFYFTNTSDKPVISKLKIAEEGKLCSDATYLYTKYPQYILDKNFTNYGCQHKINGKLFNDIEVLDYKTKKQLYNDSNIDVDSKYSDKTLDYFDYPFYSLEANMALYIKRYNGYDKKCLLENTKGFNDFISIFSFKKIFRKNKSIENIVFVNKFTLWFSVVSLAIIIFTNGYIYIIDGYPIWIWTGINILTYISMLIPLIINLPKINEIENFPICGNDMINKKIEYYQSTQTKFKVTTILSLIFVNLQLLFNIIIIVFRYYEKIFEIFKKNDFENKEPINTEYN